LQGEIAQINTKEGSVSEEEFANTAKELDEKIKALSQLVDESKLPHFYINKLFNERGGVVTINHFNYSIVSATTSIGLEGNAKTRDGLLAFKSRLEKTDLFSKVDFPIDLLVKTKDIDFSMTLK
jgi:hypothetical protein